MNVAKFHCLKNNNQSPTHYLNLLNNKTLLCKVP